MNLEFTTLHTRYAVADIPFVFLFHNRAEQPHNSDEQIRSSTLPMSVQWILSNAHGRTLFLLLLNNSLVVGLPQFLYMADLTQERTLTEAMEMTMSSSGKIGEEKEPVSTLSLCSEVQTV